jgi:ubiquitin-protein ligase
MLNWCFDPDVLETEGPLTKRLKSHPHTDHTAPIDLRPMPFISVPQFPFKYSIFDQAEREQALRDYKVTIEYKHLKSHAPGGVYIIPSIDNLRKFYGVIFVRRGPYMNGIFKFTLDLPMKYNDVNTHPTITFTSRVYNPYVDPATGKLDILTMYPRWDPTRHYLVTVLTFVKKIFYAKSFDDAVANIEAKELAINDPIAFTTNIHLCVTESNTLLYTKVENDDETNGSNLDIPTIQFSEEIVAHRVLRDLLKETVKDPSTISKNVILSLVEKARNA